MAVAANSLMLRTKMQALLAALAFLTVASAAPDHASASNLLEALASAYQTNPQLNAERARVRAIDETVPQALSGYRPQVTATADIGAQYVNSNVGSATTAPAGVGITGTQILFNGLRTANRTRQAESLVFAGREGLRLLDQQILLDAVTAYMDVIRDAAILDLQRRNVAVLQEQLGQTRERAQVGEVTRTDIAQAESRLAAARSFALAAESNFTTSRALYRRVIGVDPPSSLTPGKPVDHLSPATLGAAVTQGLTINPLVTAAMHGVDIQQLQVKIDEGALYPTVALQGTLQQRHELLSGQRQFSALAIAQVVIPLYQGGAEYALIRQSKETLGQQRINVELQRDLVRSRVIQSWGLLQAARAQITAAQAQVSATEFALNGVREEARVGQRTTLDVLNAQQELVNARVLLVTAQRDRVVFSYGLLAAVGNLSPTALALRIQQYDPRTHYHQVRDAWSGVRTPDGR